MATPSIANINKKNEFLGSLVNKIGRQEYASKAYLNPLAKFKKGFIDNANEIEEIYVARVQGLSQDLDGTTTLKRVKPDVKTLYHNQEYGKCYTATITDKQVRQAFTSKDGVKRIADEILSQQHTGVEYDEYVAMKKAIDALSIRPQMILVDAVHIPDIGIPQVGIVKGDAKSISIAAASIVAKVYRDRLMTEYDALYPEYKFAKNKGYGTKEHMQALHEIGMSPIHRKSFVHI